MTSVGTIIYIKHLGEIAFIGVCISIVDTNYVIRYVEVYGGDSHVTTRYRSHEHLHKVWKDLQYEEEYI